MPNFRRGFKEPKQPRIVPLRICLNCGEGQAVRGDIWCAACVTEYAEFDALNERYADWGGMGHGYWEAGDY